MPTGVPGKPIELIVDLVRDVFAIAAIGSIVYGAWLIYPPAGFIAGGVLTIAGIVFHAAGSSSRASGE